MFKFFFKKNFADIWDNLFHLLIVNLTYLVLIGLCIFTVIGIGKLNLDEAKRTLAYILAVMVLCPLFSVFIMAEGGNCEKISVYDQPKLRYYFASIKTSLKDGILFGLFIGLIICVSWVSLPFYFNIWLPSGETHGNFIGILMMAMVFWAELISLLALQWFMPVRNLMHNNFRKCLKKSYIIFFDNVGFTIGLALVNLLNIIITVFTLGLLPGFSGIQLTSTDALRLRLYKYDWYEVNPGMTKAQRKEVPWDDLLANDKKLLGKRNFKSFLFPWKE